jgi:hypothetical protein
MSGSSEPHATNFVLHELPQGQSVGGFGDPQASPARYRPGRIRFFELSEESAAPQKIGIRNLSNMSQLQWFWFLDCAHRAEY